MTAVAAGLVLGLAGSFHCAAMCGPLVSLVAPVLGRRAATGLWYQVGRVGAYLVIGVMAGLTGAAARVAGFGRGMSLAAGGLMMAAALGFVLGSRTGAGAWWTGRLTKGLAAVGRLREVRPTMAAIAAGAINGALPCGLVYAAALAATTTGHPIHGAGVLTAFGLGTTPAMFGMWTAASRLPVSLRQRFRSVAPAALFVVGLLLVLRGITMVADAAHAH